MQSGLSACFDCVPMHTADDNLHPEMRSDLAELRREMEGELDWNATMRVCYATDASVYRELPLAVARPKGVEDLRRLLAFARRHGVIRRRDMR